MNRDYVVGRLKQFNGKVMEQWCKLHDDKIGMAAARRHQVAGRTQAQCAILRHESAQQLKTFKQRCRTWQQPANALPSASVHRQQNRHEAGNRTSATLVSVKNHADVSPV